MSNSAALRESTQLSDREKLDRIQCLLKKFLQERVTRLALEASKISSDLEALWLRLETAGSGINVADISSYCCLETRGEFLAARAIYLLVCSVLGCDAQIDPEV